MKRNKVVVIGLGVVSSIGENVFEFWRKVPKITVERRLIIYTREQTFVMTFLSFERIKELCRIKGGATWSTNTFTPLSRKFLIANMKPYRYFILNKSN